MCRDIFGEEIWPESSQLMEHFEQYYHQLVNVIVVHPYYSKQPITKALCDKTS